MLLQVMTDQDYDGSHIKGLILNFVQHWSLPQREFKKTAASVSHLWHICIVQVAVIVQAPRLHDGVCHTDCRRLCVPGLRAALRCPSDRGEGEPPELHAAVLHYAGHLMLQAREVSRGLREEAVRYSRYSAIQKFSSPQQRLVNQLGCCVSVSPSFQLCLALVFQASWQREHH